VESSVININSPKVSIGMPVYNGERFIREALDSLLAQTFINFEIIISDNASTDETRQICLEYVAKDKRVRYYRNDVNLGPIANFNRVLNLSTGQYFMWAAHDDRWEPSFVALLVQTLDANPRVALASCRFVNIDEDGRLIRTFKTNWAYIFSRSKFWQFAFIALFDVVNKQQANHIYGLMRREVLLENGGMIYIPNVDFCGEDILTLLRLLACWDFAIVDQVLFNYRVRSLPTRQDEPLAGYIWQRLFKPKSGYHGALLTFLIRNHAFYSNMRKLIKYDSPLPLFEKFLLRLAISLKEVWRPIRDISVTGLRELHIMR
jgi:glycosyltransferase involved in cell wall biosynthesis